MSKTLEMVDLAMARFARFHVNGSWKDIAPFEQVNISVQISLGKCYYDGTIWNKNMSTAKEWFGKACDSGSEEGCDMYRKLNEQGC